MQKLPDQLEFKFDCVATPILADELEVVDKSIVVSFTSKRLQRQINLAWNDLARRGFPLATKAG